MSTPPALYGTHAPAASLARYPSLKDKVVVVTGGATGIGAALTQRFAEQGSRVACLDINGAAGAALAAGLSEAGGTAHAVAVDLTDIAALKQAMAEVRAALGPVTVLVNNAAHDARHVTQDVTAEEFDAHVAVNLKHQFFAAQAVLPDMRAAGGGSIINFGSISWMAGMGGMPIYTACKSGVIGLTRALARENGPYNIRVNAIAPGWIMTPRQEELWLTPEGEQELMQRQCLKRKLYPDDVARFVLFLASDDAAAMTSQHYVVDGGWV
jgi:NAD(P)-dependent dehydrogenase (short-subunit alcohol dehydrogenase family)